MEIPCPACRARNESGPTCRRCKADLSLLFELEARRSAAVGAARSAARSGDRRAAGAWLAEAERLRAGDDLRRLRAVLSLIEGDYASAWREYLGLTRRA